MSMKVYNAYWVKVPSKMWDLIWKIRDTAEAKAVELLRAHYVKLVREMDSDDPEYKKAWKKEGLTRTEVGFRLMRAHDEIREQFKKNVTSLHWDTYSLEVSFTISPYEGEYYLRTFCEAGSILGEVFDFVPEMRELADFHYQNSSDKPKNISKREWDHRRRVWDGIAAKYNDVGNHVTVNVVSWHNFFRVDPWFKLAEEWRKEPPVLPSREEIWALQIGGLKAIDDISFKRGLIEANKGTVRVVKRGRKWFSVINGVEQEHKTLNLAADHVYFEHLPESTKEMITRMMEDHKRRQAALPKPKRKK